MKQHEVVVDGKLMGKFPKSDKLKRLGILKGITVKTVDETARERALRLQKQREFKQNKQANGGGQEQPSLIDGIPTIRAFRAPEVSNDAA